MNHYMGVPGNFPLSEAQRHCERLNDKLEGQRRDTRSYPYIALQFLREETSERVEPLEQSRVGVVVKMINADDHDYCERLAVWLERFKCALWEGKDLHPTLFLNDSAHDYDNFTGLVHQIQLWTGVGHYNNQICTRITGLVEAVGSQLEDAHEYFYQSEGDNEFIKSLAKHRWPFYRIVPALAAKPNAWRPERLDSSTQLEDAIRSARSARNRLYYIIYAKEPLEEESARDSFLLPLEGKRWARCWPVKATSTGNAVISAPPAARSRNSDRYLGGN